MTQNIYFDQIKEQNIDIRIPAKGMLSGRKYRDMSGHTVIVMADDYEDENIIRELADTILGRGCKNIAFCGSTSDQWQDIFSEEDRQLNGFNDITGYEDFAVMWRFEDPEYLAAEVEGCWNEVLIICSNNALVKECRNILSESAWI